MLTLLFCYIFVVLSGSNQINMKPNLLLLWLLLGIAKITAAQTSGIPLDPDSKKIMYRAVVDQQGTPNYLYDKSIEWFGYYYPNPQSVYTVQDKVNGKVEGVARLKVYNKDEKSGLNVEGGMLQYLLKLEFKENKYRYTLTDFRMKNASGSGVEKWLNKNDPAYNPNWDSYIYQIDTTMQRLIATLKEKMKPSVIKKDEW
jgi:hypothetical protein